MTDALAFDLMVDPATLGTAQQKRYAYANGRLRTFTDKRVARGMRIVEFLARNTLAKNRSGLPPHGTPVRLEATYLYAIPNSRRRGRNAYLPGSPCTSHALGDAENRHKAVQDALAKAGLFADDKDVSDLHIRKRWTDGTPHIHIEVRPDVDSSGELTEPRIQQPLAISQG